MERIVRATPNIDLIIEGIPATVDEEHAAPCRARLLRAVGELMVEAGLDRVSVRVGTRQAKDATDDTRRPTRDTAASERDEPTAEGRAAQYAAHAPRFAFEQLIVPDALREDLLAAVDVIRLEGKIYDDWGLRAVEPFPKTALNFHGPPGTGKTLAAHGIASALGRRILVASYAEIESKFHGDGPKNVKAIFQAAEREQAVLFIDEADSLLSRRLTNVSQGSEQAINSMRSQLLICLEQFRGVVVFATNLVENYDKAFETRVRHVRFALPDAPARERIWLHHFPASFPVPDREAVARELAVAIDDVCGRDIRNAVLDAALRGARGGAEQLGYAHFADAIARIRAARIEDPQHGTPLSDEDKGRVGARISRALAEGSTGG
jgi:ATP-dependent Zn protease